MRYPSFRSVFLAFGVFVALPTAAKEASPPKPPAADGPAFNEAATQVLLASDKPRDWVLAAQLSVGRGDTQATRELLQKAAAAAPDDVLVQWIWANNGMIVDDPKEDRSAALRKLEPDNVAAWTLELTRAARNKDEAGVDAALKHMAAAKRDDVHWVDTTLAWTEALQRTLSHAQVRATAKRMNPTTSPEMLVADMALGLSAAFGVPAYQPLALACDPKTKPAPSDARKADCATVGRLMLSHGSTILTQRMGANILRKVGQFGAEEQQQLRELDWIMAQYKTMSAPKGDKSDDVSSQLKEWTLDHKVGDREIDSWKRRLARHGMASTPPDGWVSQRETRDAARAAKADKADAASEKQ